MRGAGVDCAGVVEGVALELGLVPGYHAELATRARRDYARSPDGTMQQLLDQYLVQIPEDDRRPGDVALIAWARLPQHVAVFVARDRIVHAYETAGKVVEVSYAGSLRRATRQVYRFPEVV